MSQTPANPPPHPDQCPLLQHNENDTPVRPTPLPKVQLTVLLLTCLIEPLSSHCIFPFINHVVGQLDITGGDDRKTGYYAGLIESIFYATQTLTVFQWSRVSDHIGRKPILLIGTFGLCISMVLFGLSRTFWGLVLSRCITGALNGNTGVMKSMMAELTDQTNQAQGFAFLPITWSTGAVLGPIIGGILYRPHEQFPQVFSSPFWEAYPYFLPCAVTSVFCASTFVAILLVLKETLPVGPLRKQPLTAPDCETTSASKYGAVDGGALGGTGLSNNEGPVPLRSLLHAKVLLPIANYAALALLEIAMFSLLPLYYATPIEHGGLGFTPPTIGLWMSSIGILNGVFQAILFAPLVSRLGPKTLFRIGQSTYVLIFVLFPAVNAIARRWGVNFVVHFLLSSLVCCYVIQNTAFTSILMYITAAAPNRRSVGAVNGLAQMAASIVRTIGPAMATSMFAFSMQYGILGGHVRSGEDTPIRRTASAFSECMDISSLSQTVSRMNPNSNPKDGR